MLGEWPDRPKISPIKRGHGIGLVGGGEDHVDPVDQVQVEMPARMTSGDVADADRLEEYSPTSTLPTYTGSLDLTVELPMPGVSLIELTPER